MQTATKNSIFLRRIVFASLFSAMSIVLGKYLAFTALTVRFSFENLPILAAGIMLGPLWGALVGVIADLIGCVLVGYEINFIITLGAATVGLLSGAVSRLVKNPLALRVSLCVALAHFFGSVCVKSLGFFVYYGTPYVPVFFERLGVYAIIATAEVLILLVLFSNKGIKMLAEKV